VEIRKTKRTEELQKKRREGEVEQTGESSGFPESTTSTAAKVRAFAASPSPFHHAAQALC
jgi:hypothetical protein